VLPACPPAVKPEPVKVIGASGGSKVDDNPVSVTGTVDEGSTVK